MCLRDEELVEQLSEAAKSYRPILVALLGDSEGTVGPAALRELVHERGRGSSDLRCAALLALAKRCHEQAHDDYVEAFRSSDPDTRDFAALVLAVYGRDGLWDEVFERLRTALKEKLRPGSDPASEVMCLIIYLARHATPDPGRASALATLLRQHWDDLDMAGEEEELLRTYWPDVAPGGPTGDEIAAPDHMGMQTALKSSPLFDPIPIEDWA